VEFLEGEAEEERQAEEKREFQEQRIELQRAKSPVDALTAPALARLPANSL
jgi:hypothetical protein